MDKDLRKKERVNIPYGMKEFSLDVKKIDVKARTIEGYGAVWNVVDSYGDVLTKECCDKSILERGPDSATHRKILLLNQHNQSTPIGHFLELKSDDYGLFFKAYVDKIQKGNEVLEQIDSGTINQFSIGFNYVWSSCDWADDYEYDGKVYNEVFICKELKLWEISAVTFGANEYTHAIKSNDTDIINKEVSNLVEALNEGLEQKDLLRIRQVAHKYNQFIKALVEKTTAKRSIEPNKPPTIDYEKALETINKHL